MGEGGECCCCGAGHGVTDGDEEGEEVVYKLLIWGEGERGDEWVGEGLEEAGLVEYMG